MIPEGDGSVHSRTRRGCVASILVLGLQHLLGFIAPSRVKSDGTADELGQRTLNLLQRFRALVRPVLYEAVRKSVRERCEL